MQRVLRSINFNFTIICLVTACPRLTAPEAPSTTPLAGEAGAASARRAEATAAGPPASRLRCPGMHHHHHEFLSALSTKTKKMFLFQTPLPRPRSCERSRPPAAPRGPDQRAAHAQPRRRGERRTEAPRPAVGQTFRPQIPQIDLG